MVSGEKFFGRSRKFGSGDLVFLCCRALFNFFGELSGTWLMRSGQRWVTVFFGARVRAAVGYLPSLVGTCLIGNVEIFEGPSELNVVEIP